MREQTLRRWLAVALVVTTLALVGWLVWRAVRTGIYAARGVRRP